MTAQAAGTDFAGIRTEFGLPGDFPAPVLAEAEQAVSADNLVNGQREDASDLPLVTVDPPGSKDLDQAMLLERRSNGRGFRVHYAIADLGEFVQPGGALDHESRSRGQTIYLPDGNVPLHPTVLSEGAASLLPDQVRPAVLWTIDCDADGLVEQTQVRRALVRSVARLDYETVQASVLAGTPHPSVAELPIFGKLRRTLAVARGAIELQLPEQQVSQGPDGSWELTIRVRAEVEAWNAEISLLTGMCAAEMMLSAKVGVLRTLPASEHDRLGRAHRAADAMGISWPAAESLSTLLADLDPTQPESLVLYMEATKLLRGAGYTAFDGSEPAITGHAGIGAPYTHVTAPIRRLVDRFATECCLAVSAGKSVPDWVRMALPTLPGVMGGSDALSTKVERACLDQVEAWVLAGQVGATFDAVVLRAEATSGEVFVTDPPVMAKCEGANLPEGERINVQLTEVDMVRRRVSFTRVPQEAVS